MSDPVYKVELSDRTRWRFVVDVGTKPDGKRDQRRMTFDTKREAVRRRAEILSEVGRGVYTKPD